MPKPTKWLKGKLLLDPGKLRGSFFHRSVILICQHDSEGAFGLILNRGTGHKVGEAIVAHLPDNLRDMPLFHGGPVQQQAMSFLHSDTFLPNANVMANLNLGHSLDALVELGESFSPTQRIRVFAGYAGWAPGQLEDELKRETWMIMSASLETVYHPQPATLWKTLLRRKGGIYRLVANAPEDLSSN